MRRDLRRASFADGLVNQRGGKEQLAGSDRPVAGLAGAGEGADRIYASDEGRPSYPLLTYVKLLLLQQWYGLSDPGLEQAVDDRLSFRRFAGLPLDEGVPDHSAIWRFRQALAAHGVAEALFEEVGRQLDACGLIVRRGTLIDATLLQASVKPPSPKQGTVRERDPEAGWTQKNGANHFGYKAHVAMDEGSEIIRTALLTAADLHDRQPAAALICGDEQAAYGDKAYASQALRTKLVEAGINDRLMYRAARNRLLKPWQTWFNKAVAGIRAAVERRFAIMKRHYGHRRVRYIGLVRNACHLHLLCTAINLKRALALVG